MNRLSIITPVILSVLGMLLTFWQMYKSHQGLIDVQGTKCNKRFKTWFERNNLEADEAMFLAARNLSTSLFILFLTIGITLIINALNLL